MAQDAHALAKHGAVGQRQVSLLATQALGGCPARFSGLYTMDGDVVLWFLLLPVKKLPLPCRL